MSTICIHVLSTIIYAMVSAYILLCVINTILICIHTLLQWSIRIYVPNVTNNTNIHTYIHYYSGIASYIYKMFLTTLIYIHIHTLLQWSSPCRCAPGDTTQGCQYSYCNPNPCGAGVCIGDFVQQYICQYVFLFYTT